LLKRVDLYIDMAYDTELQEPSTLPLGCVHIQENCIYCTSHLKNKMKKAVVKTCTKNKMLVIIEELWIIMVTSFLWLTQEMKCANPRDP